MYCCRYHLLPAAQMLLTSLTFLESSAPGTRSHDISGPSRYTAREMHEFPDGSSGVLLRHLARSCCAIAWTLAMKLSRLAVV